MSKVTPCLILNGQAEEAANFYVSLFPNSRITRILRCTSGMPMPEGSVLLVEFTLSGQTYQALNAGPDVAPNMAISLSIACTDQAEVDHLWEGLIANGGEPSQCSWCRDRFGIWWQVVPEALPRALNGDDPAGRERAMHAMMGMTKIDVAAIEAAYQGVA